MTSTNWAEHYERRAAEDEAAERDAVLNPDRVPLTASQHILHLLLTVFTAGLWAPVWAFRAWRGNPA